MTGVIPLTSLSGNLESIECKLHYAVWNGEEYPIDIPARSWDEWVGWNSWRGPRDDFNRQFIFSLAQARDDRRTGCSMECSRSSLAGRHHARCRTT